MDPIPVTRYTVSAETLDGMCEVSLLRMSASYTALIFLIKCKAQQNLISLLDSLLKCLCVVFVKL